jgi:hypothetical protein
MTLQDWADATTYVASQYADVSPLQGADWQAWGMTFFNNQQLGAMHPPNPYDYSKWQDWAYQLGASMLNARGSQSRAQG